jgi:16S rRNA C967 or C1407 C5-methylase (RsmB/RsmF family)
LFVTNNDARKFPNLKIGKEMENFKFDKILCDVPCSGDGTLRKNNILWKTFHAHLGHSLHALQLDILIRGLDLLKKGGYMTYSTCSFNPIENEAVV